MEEKSFYNGVNIILESNYKKIATFYQAYQSWEKTYAVVSRELGEVDLEKEDGRLRESGVELILQDNERYPELLKEIPYPPHGIYLRGEIPRYEKAIAIVGTRKATPEGREQTKEIAEKLARAGVVIISGLALGIDAAAHEGCLAGGGKTWAVLAGGLQEIYPSSHSKLAEEIINGGGGLVSEYPLGAPCYPPRFLERNRITSGLASGTVIIEAPERSGALATARFALDQNRDIYVMPGAIKNPNYKGNLRLLRDGARIITSTEDLIEDLGIEEQPETELEEAILSEKQRLIMKTLKAVGEAMMVDRIAAIAKLDLPETSRELTDLIIEGKVKEAGGKYFL